MPGRGRSACDEGLREPGTHRAGLWAGAWARRPEKPEKVAGSCPHEVLQLQHATSWLQPVGSSSLSRHGTQAPCIANV